MVHLLAVRGAGVHSVKVRALLGVADQRREFRLDIAAKFRIVME